MTGFLRTSANLVALGVLTLALIAYAGATWAREALFDDRYPVTITLEETGGLVETQSVTLMGTEAGQIEHIALTPGGVRMRMLIQPDAVIPREPLVQILRRSAIGEQTLNLIPVPEGWQPDGESVIPRLVERGQDWEAAEPGDEIEPVHVAYPVSIREILALSEELFEVVPKQDLSTTITELAAAVGGRGETLVDLNRQSVELNETLVSAIPDFERLIDTSEPVLTALRDSRNSIAQMITNVADLSDILAENRPTLEGLIDDGTVTLREVDALVRDNRANLTCVVDDLLGFTEVNVDNLHWVQQLLDLNTYFWDTVDRSFQWDPYRPGINYFRVSDVIMESQTGGTYEVRRPTPTTKPGAACQTPFGLGVNAVRQPDHQEPDPTSPGIDFAPLVEDEGGQEISEPRRTASGREPLPATGGGMALVAPFLAGLALWLRRRP